MMKRKFSSLDFIVLEEHNEENFQKATKHDSVCPRLAKKQKREPNNILYWRSQT